MGFQFQHHYTIEEARALLPQLREWLQQLAHYRQQLETCDMKLLQLTAQGDDVGGATVRDRIIALSHIHKFLKEFSKRDIQVKDIDRGLVDFPAIIGGREVFLCWEKDEEDIEFWHDLNTGYAGREPI